MKQIRKILCPVDFSEPSESALSTAVDLAEHYSAEVVLMHAVNDIDPMPSPSYTLTPQMVEQIPQLMEQMQENARQALQNLIDQYIGRRVPADVLVTTGPPAHSIVNAVDELNADLIVIATHGRSGIRGFFFGSVAEKVVRTADCPVLTVKFKGA